MIKVYVGDESFELHHWQDGKWKDKAGHIWTMERTGKFTNPKHGEVIPDKWHVIHD